MIKTEDIRVYGKSINDLTDEEWKKLRREDWHKFMHYYFNLKTIECGCGAKIKRYSRYKHYESKKHKQYLTAN